MPQSCVSAGSGAHKLWNWHRWIFQDIAVVPRVPLRVPRVVSLARFSTNSLDTPIKVSRLQELRKQLAGDAHVIGNPSRARATRKSPTADSSVHATARTSSGSPGLTDTHGRVHSYLRISLTERCNLRCTYCMPKDGVDLTPSQDLLTSDETVQLAAMFVRMGVTKIRLTGGEPTLRRDLVDLVSRLGTLRDRGLSILGMTTNGVALRRILPDLKSAGLTHLNISMDTLQPSRFESISRRPEEHWHRTWAAVQTALELGWGTAERPLKLNVVVERGVNEDEVPAFVNLTKSLPLQVRFIELMPFAGNDWRPEAVVPWRDMVGAVHAEHEGFHPIPEQEEVNRQMSVTAESVRQPRGTGTGNGFVGLHDTARPWEVPGHMGTVGFITTMTDAFCSTCTRLRMTADGNLRTCLHGREEFSLRDVLRCNSDVPVNSPSGENIDKVGVASDVEERVQALVRAALLGKHAALGGATGLANRIAAAKMGLTDSSRPMIKIGG